MFFSVITAPTVLAQLIDFLITIGVVNCHILNTQSGSNGKLLSSYWPKFAVLRLFVETMPIYQAVATGNRNNELYRETTRSNWKKTLDRHNARL
jgi:hypothetical protein